MKNLLKAAFLGSVLATSAMAEDVARPQIYVLDPEFPVGAKKIDRFNIYARGENALSQICKDAVADNEYTYLDDLCNDADDRLKVDTLNVTGNVDDGITEFSEADNPFTRDELNAEYDKIMRRSGEIYEAFANHDLTMKPCSQYTSDSRIANYVCPGVTSIGEKGRKQVTFFALYPGA